MLDKDSIAISTIYVGMLEENKKPFSFPHVMTVAIRKALYGRTFPFEFVGQVSDLDDELEYITFANAPIGKRQVRDITRAYLNNSLRVVWEGQPKDKSERALGRIRKLVGDKYKIESQKYV